MRLTRQALEICRKYGLESQILTKGAAELIERDLELMKEADTHLGLTISFIDDADRKEWEPNAAPIDDRLAVLEKAHKNKIFTWVSIEPVIFPEQAYSIVDKVHKYVDFWKIGKLNHMQDCEAKIDWFIFRNSIETLLKDVGANYYLKQDLVATAKRSARDRHQ